MSYEQQELLLLTTGNEYPEHIHAKKDSAKSSGKKDSSRSTKSIQALQKRKLDHAVTHSIFSVFGNTLTELCKKSPLKLMGERVICQNGTVIEINLEIEYIGNIKEFQQLDSTDSGSQDEAK